jgi:hypothetical protein
MYLHRVAQSVQLAIGCAAHLAGLLCQNVPHVDVWRFEKKASMSSLRVDDAALI